jgi:hypothetical protein
MKSILNLKKILIMIVISSKTLELEIIKNLYGRFQLNKSINDNNK